MRTILYILVFSAHAPITGTSTTLQRTATAVNSTVVDYALSERKIPGYQLSDEETVAYWSLHESHTDNTARSRDLTSGSNSSGSILEKRSPEGKAVCITANRILRDRDGVIIERWKYSFVQAKCHQPFNSPYFKVTCDVLWTLRGERVRMQPGLLLGTCAKEHVCVPDWYVNAWFMQSPSARHAGWGLQHTPHDDIFCYPLANKPSLPNPIMIKPAQEGSSTCSPVTKIPADIDTEPNNPKSVPARGMTVLISESLEVAGGGAFNASKIYIRDLTSSFLEPWKRRLGIDNDVVSDRVMLHPGESRKVQFCVEFAKGFTHWLVLHYGIFDITNMQRSHAYRSYVEADQAADRRRSQ